MTETALSIAREKAAARGIGAQFAACDALHLNRLGRQFQTVLDCGLFHSFEPVVRTPVSHEELMAAFTDTSDWNVASVSADRTETRFSAQGAPAWLAKVERT